MTNTIRCHCKRGAILAAALISIAACAGEDPVITSDSLGPAASPGVVETVTPGGASPTPGSAPSPVVSDAPAPSSVAPASTSPTTTAVPLPSPVLLPLDDETPEPVVPLGSIVIPAIGIDRPMFEGIRLPTFDMGPGHWPGTAMPGQIGNVVVGGHRTSSHADFGDLDLLEPGDEVGFIDTSGAEVTYLVESTEIVDPFAAAIVNQTRAYTATLFACHPKGSTDQRIVVRLVMATA